MNCWGLLTPRHAFHPGRAASARPHPFPVMRRLLPLLAILFVGTVALAPSPAGVERALSALAGRAAPAIPDGMLDASFGATGRRVTPINAGEAFATLHQPDGRVVVAGHGIIGGGDYNFILMRLFPDGGPDPSFGEGGQVVTDFAGLIDGAFALALEPDGRILAAGYATVAPAAGGRNFALARYLPDGSLDPTFGTGGRVTTDFGGLDVAQAVTIQSDGRIVAAGYTSSGGMTRIALARYLPSGTLDPAFGTGGRVVTDLSGDNEIASAVAVQTDGGIVVAGRAGTIASGSLDFVLLRYLASGALDPAFGTGGVVTTDFAGLNDSARDLLLLPDGRIVAGGVARPSSDANPDFALVRYFPSGALDPTFGTGGKVTTDFDGAGDAISALGLLPDGRIAAAGLARVPGTNRPRFAQAQYLASGALDPSFGVGGKAVTDVGEEEEVYALVVLPDGKRVVAGGRRGATFGDYGFVVAQHLPDGSLDPTFGGPGWVTTAIGASLDEANALVIQPDGKLVAAGFTVAGGNWAGFALARYLPDGSLDAAFGTGGRVVTSVGGLRVAHALVRQSDGKLVAAGWGAVPGSLRDFALARYLPSGALDPAFGAGGTVMTDFDGLSDQASALVLQPDGKLLAAGGATVREGASIYSGFGLARYNPDGSLDPSFGTGGRVFTRVPGGSGFIHALALQPDGKLVAAGSASVGPGQSAFALLRYHPDGSLDTGFATGGLATTHFGTGFDGAYALVIEPDGKLTAAGRAHTAGAWQFALARYLPSGVLDPAFGSGGRVVTFFGAESAAHALVRQSDGKLVAAGRAGPLGGGQDFALARYTSEGVLDPTFGMGGTLRTDFVGSGDWAYALALQHDGKLVAAGYSYRGGIGRFALARYHNAAEAPPPDTTPPVCGPITLERENGVMTAIVSSASDPESGIASVLFTTTRNVQGYVGPAGGTLVSYAQGATAPFDPATTPAVALRAERISLSAGGAFVVRVTNGAGLSVNCDPVVSQLSATAPEAFSLEAPYPNPARASEPVRLAFAVAEAADMRLAVYDLTGREVARLVDGAMEPGRYEVAWTGADGASGRLAAGVYVVRMEAGAFTRSLRVTVVR